MQRSETCEVQHAYATIAKFFDAYSLADALHHARRVLKTAGGFYRWRTNPVNIPFFAEKTEGLIKAALTIRREEAEREAALLPLADGEVPSLTDYKTYCGTHHRNAPWYFVPRHLSRNEVVNPYRVFKKIAAAGGLRKWRRVLKEIMYDALGNTHLNNRPDDYDTLEVYLLLCKLIEAAHLILVRAIDEVNGEPVKKWSEKLKGTAEENNAP